MREINLELIRVTEAAAICASRWIGSGDKQAADKDATEAMRDRLNQVAFRGTIIIGEGKKDKSHGLFSGEKVGRYRDDASHERLEIAVDPIDGTRQTVISGPEAMSVMAVAGEKCLFATEAHYMNKLAWGPAVAEKTALRITDPLPETIQKVSTALRKKPARITACILDRPRHESMIRELRTLGVRIKLIQDCDISGAIAACLDDGGIDLLCGIGGAPEAVITACAIKCLRGGFQAQLVDREGKVSDPKVYEMEDLVRGHCAFAATGITTGSLLTGVRYTKRGLLTHSVFMRSESGTVRWLTVQHGN